MWQKGEPTEPGWYILEFSGGDRFVVAHAFYDEDEKFQMEDANSYAYIRDVVDVIINHLPISPPERNRIDNRYC